jgi:hypothetical protein
MQSIMIDVSTGGQRIQTEEERYKELFLEVAAEFEQLQHEGILISNPNPYKSLWEWYTYWSSKLGSYRDRRTYIGELFNGVIHIFQTALHHQAANSLTIEQFTQDIKWRMMQSDVAVSSFGFSSDIQLSLKAFQKDHPDPSKTGFIMMKFSRTKAHEEIAAAIKSALGEYGIKGVRADDKQYHDDLFPNIQTYIHGCAFGIAVFERIEADDFNPNVSLEVGYMLALKRPVCLLKDRTLRTLHTDLIGKLYRLFDPQDIYPTITKELGKWLSDKGLVK